MEHNPGQLFAACYSACFVGALRGVAETEQVFVPDEVSVTAIVGIGPSSTGAALAIELKIDLPGFSREKAESLVHDTHRVCPISNAIRDNVDVTFTIA